MFLWLLRSTSLFQLWILQGWLRWVRAMSRAGADAEREEVVRAAGASPGREITRQEERISQCQKGNNGSVVGTPVGTGNSAAQQCSGNRACSPRQQPAPSSACPEQLNHPWGWEVAAGCKALRCSRSGTPASNWKGLPALSPSLACRAGGLECIQSNFTALHPLVTICLSWVQFCITPLGISEIAPKFTSDIPFFFSPKETQEPA